MTSTDYRAFKSVHPAGVPWVFILTRLLLRCRDIVIKPLRCSSAACYERLPGFFDLPSFCNIVDRSVASSASSSESRSSPSTAMWSGASSQSLGTRHGSALPMLAALLSQPGPGSPVSALQMYAVKWLQFLSNRLWSVPRNFSHAACRVALISSSVASVKPCSNSQRKEPPGGGVLGFDQKTPDTPRLL